MNSPIATHAPQDSGVPAGSRDFSVKDRVVVITGAAQGIGRELARQFAAAGAIPVVADLNIELAKSVVSEIELAGGSAHAIAVDVADEVSVDAMVHEVMSRHGRIDVLINNAALFTTLKKQPFDEIPLDLWEKVMKVNITGTYLATRAVAEHMRKAGWGRIINVTSDAVRNGTAGYLHYVTTKSAMTGMSNSLARELGPYGITVNCVRPGSVATEVTRVDDPTTERRTRTVGLQCLPDVMMSSDMVGLFMFLCTEASAFVTGQTLACNAGYTHNG